MGLRKLGPQHYRMLASMSVPALFAFFGMYQQHLHDQDFTSYRNKSKMFGGKALPQGEQAWY